MIQLIFRYISQILPKRNCERLDLTATTESAADFSPQETLQ